VYTGAVRAFVLLALLSACSPMTMPRPDSGMGSCGVMQSPPNLLADGSFECGAGAEWSVQFGDFAVVSGGHSGAKAGQLTASSTGAGQMGIGMPIVAMTDGSPYCVNAWVKGTASDMRLEVLATKAALGNAFASPVQADWLEAPMGSNLKVQVAAGDTLYLRVKIQNGTAGQTLLLDDVDFWESTTGNCDERH
jgi:hypothetical protein